MSEPKSRARRIDVVVAGILHWKVHDDRIDYRSDCYALRSGRRSVLIDPLPLVEPSLESLGKVDAICLTGSCHQRSAWRYRRRFGAEIFAPAGAEGLEEEPDGWYRKGAKLPGGLRAVHAPGPTEAHYAFHLSRGAGAVFCADILTHDGKAVRFVSEEYQDDPARTRETARRLLKLRFGVLCFAHGAPITKNARAAIRQAMGETGQT